VLATLAGPGILTCLVAAAGPLLSPRPARLNPALTWLVQVGLVLALVGVARCGGG